MLMASQNVIVPTSSIGAGGWNYDVFLSFRGADTRKSFTDHLRDALLREGIRVFRDDEELTSGNEIASGLHQAIESSRMSLIVFSRNYALSKWCLDELVKIIECSKTKGNRVIPIFYNVDPTEVRRQTGSYGEALVSRESHPGSVNERHQIKVQAWRDALTEASFLSGRHLQGSYETKFISEIVKDVLSVISPKKLHVADHPVGVESRMDDINSLHGSGSDDVRVIGVYGMGGIGKTVIVKSLYNLHVKSFKYGCFLANVREESKQPMGLVRLQTQLLSSVHIKTSENEISSVDFGKNMIKERCRSKKILLVIDDADKLDQIKSFVGDRNWFGSGSRIIITTRDEHLLHQVVDETYQAKKLNQNESIDLFNWHAFKTDIPPADYMELSREVIAYARGLPLALEVLGSFLYRRSIEEWKSTIAKLGKIPHGQIQEKLRISYDTLEDDVKEIFLHIACFLIGMDKYYVIDILNGCGFNTEIGISVLKFRSLITVDAKNDMRMHDLLRDMGREIVREESPKELGKRSRLWSREDVCDVLKNRKGTESVEGIAIIQPSNEKLQLRVDAFANMRNLRLLQMENVSLTGRSYDHLSKELRWIYWPFYGLAYLPTNICLQNLVTLDMQHSQIRMLWTGYKCLENLKTMNLCHSKLLKVPDLSGLPKLETLLLEGCQSLCVVHESIGFLEMLSQLNLKDCLNLRHLPGSVYSLRSLQRLNTRGCISLVQEVTKSPSCIDMLKTCFGANGQGSHQSQPASSCHSKHSVVLFDPSRSPCS